MLSVIVSITSFRGRICRAPLLHTLRWRFLPAVGPKHAAFKTNRNTVFTFSAVFFLNKVILLIMMMTNRSVVIQIIDVLK